MHRLHDGIGLAIEYEDQTTYGSAVSGRAELELRNRCREVEDHRRRLGLSLTIAKSRQFSQALRSRGFADVVDDSGGLRSCWLYPDPTRVKPRSLRIHRQDGTASTIAFEATLAADLARWLGDWQRGSRPPTGGPARALWHALERCGALWAGPLDHDRLVTADVTFAGHATVAVRGSAGLALFDPFLLPASSAYSASYKPLDYEQLRPSSVFITHSHPDHYDLGFLLRFGAELPIFVPKVGRESILSIDMELRLRELGFCNVRGMGWHESTYVDGVDVTALPFYGEQPTAGQRLHPEVRNEGNTYVVHARGRRYALLADSGRDCGGDIREVARDARRRWGGVDVVFGGYRGWKLYPLQYLFSSVGRYLPFVYPEEWGVRQQIMNDADDLLDVAELWHARYVVPYADGGAPWYAAHGIGPRPGDSSVDATHFDAAPETVVEHARRRSSAGGEIISGASTVLILRPGDGLTFDAGGRPLRVQTPGYSWPDGV